MLLEASLGPGLWVHWVLVSGLLPLTLLRAGHGGNMVWVSQVAQELASEGASRIIRESGFSAAVKHLQGKIGFMKIGYIQKLL